MGLSHQRWYLQHSKLFCDEVWFMKVCLRIRIIFTSSLLPSRVSCFNLCLKAQVSFRQKNYKNIPFFCKVTFKVCSFPFTYVNKMHLINVFCRNQQLCKCGGVWSGGAGCGPECLGIISIEKMEKSIWLRLSLQVVAVWSCYQGLGVLMN